MSVAAALRSSEACSGQSDTQHLGGLRNLPRTRAFVEKTVTLAWYTVPRGAVWATSSRLPSSSVRTAAVMAACPGALARLGYCAPNADACSLVERLERKARASLAP